MTVKGHIEEEHNILPIMSDNNRFLRKVASDVTNDSSKLVQDLEHTNITLELHETILQAECDCCGLKEDCTKDYISRTRNSYSGQWVCGLCSEAVKERLRHSPVAIAEAVSAHRSFVQEFNATTRVNPKLSLTWTMREIVRRSGEKRRSIDLSGGPGMKIVRSSSCVSRIN